MEKRREDRPGGSRGTSLDRDPVFDKRSLVIGLALAAGLLAGATLWTVAYRDPNRKSAKLKDFEFAPRPPDMEKFELKDPQRQLMHELVKDRPEMKEMETPNILMTTEIKETEIREEVVKTKVLDLNTDIDVNMSKLDLMETAEDVKEVADERVDGLTPIAVLSTSPGDIYKYDAPNPRARPRARLISAAPKPGMQLKMSPRQFGDLEAVTVGDLGPVDINLLGSGDYLGAMGRSGMETRTAVDAALRWLALHQEPQGFWDANRWNRDDATMDSPAPQRTGDNEVGISALATLALMGGGNTLRKGEHRMTVLRAVQWLMKQQDPESGYLSKNMYEHAISTIALCEAFGRSPDERVALAARKAVDACVAAVAKDGGWRYTPNPDASDISVTSWFLQALKTAKLANIRFDHSVFSKGLTYLDQCTDRGGMGDSTGAVGYQYIPSLSYGSGSRALTCAGMVIRQFNGMGVNHPLLTRAAEITKGSPPKWEDKDFYYWYYATYAMHNMGGEYRLWWNRRIRDTLLDHQSRRGHQAGSWNPDKERWAPSRVYCTAMGALCLEVYYRYGEALQSFGTVADIEDLVFR